MIYVWASAGQALGGSESIFRGSFLLSAMRSSSLLSMWADKVGRAESSPLSKLVLIIRSLTEIISSELNHHELKLLLIFSWMSPSGPLGVSEPQV